MTLDGQGDVEAEKRLKLYSSSSYEMQGQLIHLDIHHVHYSVQSLSYSLSGTTGALIVMNDDIVYRSAGSHVFGIFILFLGL